MGELLLTAIVVGLGAWRVSSLLVFEDGPWAVFERLRYAVGVHQTDGPLSTVALIFSCIWCMSVWVAPVIWLLVSTLPLVGGILAAMAIVLLVERVARP